MKRLIIVCEGQTEQSFCQNVLSPYFLTKGFAVEAPTIKHSHGGIVPWETLKRQLVEHLHEGDAIVTMLIDFYRIKDSYQFPGWEEAKTIEDSQDKMNGLFQDMARDMPEDINNKPETAPSSRLMSAVTGYDKVVYGSLLAEETGLSTIRSRCPLFNSWIERIEDVCNKE